MNCDSDSHDDPVKATVTGIFNPARFNDGPKVRANYCDPCAEWIGYLRGVFTKDGDITTTV